jgi:predicted RNA-binding Zn-ribbon protein involved in translation (DUF1610 family)
MVTNPSLTHHVAAWPGWAAFIEAHTQAGDVVLDAFPQDAGVARAALDLGRRAVVLTRTPARWLTLWGALAPPDPAVVRRALVWLSTTLKRDVPLDRHLQSLYHTRCPGCGATVAARAFVWDRRRDEPVAREVVCPQCGFRGRAPVEEADVRRAKEFERRGLNYWFILEWLADAQDVAGREWAQRLLDEYTPRNLSALADVTRKIDAELTDAGDEVRRTLQYLLLRALDAGRLLRDPEDSQGRWLVERNVWQVMEEAAAELEATPLVVRAANLTAFFHPPEAEGEPPKLVLVRGSVQRLARQLPPGSVALILGAPPSLDPDAWARERLWSRWLFGRGPSAGLHPPLGGWARHVRALSATLATLAPALQSNGRVIFRFADPDPARAQALLLAAAPHFTLEALIYQPAPQEPSGLFDSVGGAYRVDLRRSAIVERRGRARRSALAAEVARTARRMAARVINQQGEPTSLDRIAVATFGQLASAGLLRQVMALPMAAEDSPLTFVQRALRQGLENGLEEGTLVGVGDTKATHWWLPRPPSTVPLADRVEELVVEMLAGGASLRVEEVYHRFPGYLTPEAELVEAALRAWGQEVEPGLWRGLETVPDERGPLVAALEDLGRHLGFEVAGSELADVMWRESDAPQPVEDRPPPMRVDGEGSGRGLAEAGAARHVFRVLSSARLTDLPPLPEGVSGHAVVPERLVELVTVKLARNPLLRQAVAERGWGFIKARHLEALARDPEADRQEFKKILGLQPIIEQAEAQMPLF